MLDSQLLLSKVQRLFLSNQQINLIVTKYEDLIIFYAICV